MNKLWPLPDTGRSSTRSGKLPSPVEIVPIPAVLHVADLYVNASRWPRGNNLIRTCNCMDETLAVIPRAEQGVGFASRANQAHHCSLFAWTFLFKSRPILVLSLPGTSAFTLPSSGTTSLFLWRVNIATNLPQPFVTLISSRHEVNLINSEGSFASNNRPRPGVIRFEKRRAAVLVPLGQAENSLSISAALMYASRRTRPKRKTYLLGRQAHKSNLPLVLHRLSN